MPLRFHSLPELSECLYAGFGVIGFVETETCLLPLKILPQEGTEPIRSFRMGTQRKWRFARNLSLFEFGPFIGKTGNDITPLPMDLFKGQDWTENMPAVIFLVAELRRTSWKYNDSNAYRVVLIEAGHIAQNMMLACANNNLTTCPTAALSHRHVSALLGLSDIHTNPCLRVVSR